MANSNKGGGFFGTRAMDCVASYPVGRVTAQEAAKAAEGYKAQYPECVVRVRAANVGTRAKYVAYYTVYVYQKRG
jgi:hypothetical protein